MQTQPVKWTCGTQWSSGTTAANLTLSGFLPDPKTSAASRLETPIPSSTSLLQQLAAARLPNSGISEIAVNASLAFIEGAKPEGEVEGALVPQMA